MIAKSSQLHYKEEKYRSITLKAVQFYTTKLRSIRLILKTKFQPSGFSRKRQMFGLQQLLGVAKSLSYRGLKQVEGLKWYLGTR